MRFSTALSHVHSTRIICAHKRRCRSPLITPTSDLTTCVASIPAASSVCPSVTDRQCTLIVRAPKITRSVRTVILGRGRVVTWNRDAKVLLFRSERSSEKECSECGAGYWPLHAPFLFHCSIFHNALLWAWLHAVMHEKCPGKTENRFADCCACKLVWIVFGRTD